jgi:hypothetical protein
MNQIKNLTALLLLLSLFMTSCDKEEIVPNEDIITKNGWLVTSMVITNEVGSFEVINEFESCELDDIVFFEEENNRFTKDQGATKCNEEEEQFEHLGYWTMLANGEKIALAMEDGEVRNMEIREIMEGHLVLHWEETSEDGTVEGYTMTLSAEN